MVGSTVCEVIVNKLVQQVVCLNSVGRLYAARNRVCSKTNGHQSEEPGRYVDFKPNLELYRQDEGAMIPNMTCEWHLETHSMVTTTNTGMTVKQASE